MSVVGGLFSDVFKSQGMAVPGAEGTIDWSKAGGIPADLNWDAIKPFQVMPPMSWAATNKGATAPEDKLASIPTTDTRSEYQKWLDSQNKSTDGSRGYDNNGKGGVAGNGTNFTDKQWDSIRQMNDEYGMWGNPVNQAALTGVSGLFTKNINDILSAQPNSISAINAWDASKALSNNPTVAAAMINNDDYNYAAQVAAQQQATVDAAVQNNADFNYSGGGSVGVTDGSDGRSYGISGSEGE